MINIIKRKSFKDVLYEWLNYKKQNIKESTYLKYLNQIDVNIIPNIDDISFKKLNLKHIEKIFNNDNILKLSNSTKNNILIIIKSAITYGIEKNWLKISKKQ